MDHGGTLKTIADMSSVSLFLAALLGYLPGIAAGLSIVYYCILIYKSKVVQRWLKKRRLRRSLKRRAARQQPVHQETPS